MEWYVVLTLVCDSLVVQEEQEFSAGQSTLVNRAYSTLLRPYSRGLYLVREGVGGWVGGWMDV